MRHSLSSRNANECVKPPGICWAIRIAGQLAGNGSSTCRIASGPPVEAPRITSFSLDTITDLSGLGAFRSPA